MITAEYRIAKRPAGRVLVDYNQNAWGRTLASVYSVRPSPTPRPPRLSPGKKWRRLSALEDFRIDNVPQRVKKVGDLLRSAAGKGRTASAGKILMTLPIDTSYPPMEAQSALAIPEGTDWEYEPKWDGFRRSRVPRRRGD